MVVLKLLLSRRDVLRIVCFGAVGAIGLKC